MKPKPLPKAIQPNGVKFDDLAEVNRLASTLRGITSRIETAKSEKGAGFGLTAGMTFNGMDQPKEIVDMVRPIIIQRLYAERLKLANQLQKFGVHFSSADMKSFEVKP